MIEKKHLHEHHQLAARIYFKLGSSFLESAERSTLMSAATTQELELIHDLRKTCIEDEIHSLKIPRDVVP